MKINYGIAKRVLNPQVPISLAGYFNKRMWDRVLDDIEVRAIVFRNGDDIAAILHFDLLNMATNVCEAILAELKSRGVTCFSKENVLFSAIHTHTAPDMCPGAHAHSEEYRQFVFRQSADALLEAMADMREGELYQGLARDGRFLFNRRYWMKNGAVVTNPGKLNPGIVRPEGDIDPEIPILSIRRNGKDDVILCSIVNHSDTVGGTGVSADWHHFLRTKLMAATGASMVFSLLGASGNINHFDVRTDMDQTNYGEAKRIGLGYAESVEAALDSMTPVKGEGWKLLCGTAESTPREVSPEEIAAARETVQKYADVHFEEGKEFTSEDLAKGAPAVLKYFAERLLIQSENKDPMFFPLVGFAFGECSHCLTAKRAIHGNWPVPSQGHIQGQDLPGGNIVLDWPDQEPERLYPESLELWSRRLRDRAPFQPILKGHRSTPAGQMARNRSPSPLNKTQRARRD